jgi:homoserine kinase
MNTTVPPAAGIPDGSGIRIRVPASTSNLGPAFDAAGVALQLYLRVDVTRRDGGRPEIDFQGKDAHLVPRDHTNLIWRTMAEVAEQAGRQLPSFTLRVENEIPITKGLGSSASACLAAAAAADFLCGLKLSREEWLKIAAAREGHPDNAAPALYGGLVSSILGDTILCSRTVFPPCWTVVAVTPDFELETKRARSVLPPEIPYRDVVFNLQRVAFLISQLSQGRREGVREAMRDRVHQPYRGPLIPGLQEILDMKDEPGLIGRALSGAGPTVVAFADSCENEIADKMCRIFRSKGLKAEARLLKADNEGLVIGVPGELSEAGCR